MLLLLFVVVIGCCDCVYLGLRIGRVGLVNKLFISLCFLVPFCYLVGLGLIWVWVCSGIVADSFEFGYCGLG